MSVLAPRPQVGNPLLKSGVRSIQLDSAIRPPSRLLEVLRLLVTNRLLPIGGQERDEAQLGGEGGTNGSSA